MHGIEARRQDEGWWGLLEHVVGQGEGRGMQCGTSGGRGRVTAKMAGKIIRNGKKEKGTNDDIGQGKNKLEREKYTKQRTTRLAGPARNGESYGTAKSATNNSRAG